MTTIPLRRAVQHEEWHAHPRWDGRGFHEHRHGVRAYVHGHPHEGLELVRLGWAVSRWTYIRGRMPALWPFALLALIWLVLILGAFAVRALLAPVTQA